MADLNKNLPVEVKEDGELYGKYLDIQLNEKKSSIKRLQLQLENLVNIEQKRILLQIDVLNRNIIKLKEERSKFEIKEVVVDVEVIEVDENPVEENNK